MLNLFRQRGLSNLIYGIIIVATIFAFVITFRPNATSKTASLKEVCVARVRGRCVDPKDFASAYRLLLPTHSAALSRKLNIKRVALDGLVERELLDDEANRLGITATDKEVTDQLFAGFVRVSVPAADPSIAQTIVQEMYQSYTREGFVSQDVAMAHYNDRDTAIPVDFRDQKTRMFDIKVYERKVRNLSNRSTTEFREEQSRELLAAKMRDIVRDPIRVSEAEAWDQYQRQHNTATVAWVPVKDAWVGRWAVDAKSADVDAWTKEHQADVSPVVEARLKDDAPKPGHLRHILVKLPYGGATDDEKALALAKLSWAAARIRGGESFAEVAREVSDDPGSATKGGDLGDKTDGFVAPFKAAADALKPGESTAGAVVTQFGYHFIERDDPAKAADVEARVKRSVARDLYTKAKVTTLGQAIARDIGVAVRDGKTPDAAIQEVTSRFVRVEKAPLLKVVNAEASDKTSADAGAPRASGKSAPEKATAAALPEKRFDAASDADAPKLETSSAFNGGGDPFPGLSPEGTTQVLGFAFASKDGDVTAEPVRTTDGFAVVQLKQHKVASPEEFDKDRDAFEEELLRAKRDEALSLYVRRLREQAKSDIRIDPTYVEEARADGGTSSSDEEDEY